MLHKWMSGFIAMGIMFSGCTRGEQLDSNAIVVNTEDASVSASMRSEDEIGTPDGVTEGWYVGEISDITGGTSHGQARMRFVKDQFELSLEMQRLAEIDTEKFFYEGWLVRPKPLSFISTGKLVKDESGIWIQDFKALTDWTDYYQYVVTLEPTDDGDGGGPNPKPAVHVAEGEMVKK